MNVKKYKRLRRSKKTRFKIRSLGAIRLCIHRSSRHMYAQIIDTLNNVIVCASTIEKKINTYPIISGGNIAAAIKVGELVAQRAKSAGIVKVAFDRSGFKYHGRVKALANSARKNGLEF